MFLFYFKLYLEHTVGDGFPLIELLCELCWLLWLGVEGQSESLVLALALSCFGGEAWDWEICPLTIVLDVIVEFESDSFSKLPFFSFCWNSKQLPI